jgi:ribosomal protein S17E
LFQAQQNIGCDFVGKSMLKPLKTKADIVMESLGDKVTADFNNNKVKIKELKLPITKSNVNKMAGYIARQKKRSKKSE